MLQTAATAILDRRGSNGGGISSSAPSKSLTKHPCVITYDDKMVKVSYKKPDSQIIPVLRKMCSLVLRYNIGKCIIPQFLGCTQNGIL